MKFFLNKQNIRSEVISFLATIGVWATTALVIGLAMSFILGTSSASANFGVLITILGLAVGLYAAYLINDRKLPKLTLVILIVVGGIFYAQTSLISRVFITGSGMESSYPNEESVWVDRLTAEFNKPQRGDVVLVKNNTLGQAEYIRRIIGLPNETVRLLGNLVIINDQNVLSEPYLHSKEECAIGTNLINPFAREWQLKNYEYLALPDNRATIPDGPVINDGNIAGKVIGVKAKLVLIKSSALSFKEYSNPNLKLSFQYLPGCVIESKNPNSFQVKDPSANSYLLEVALFAQNPQKLSTEEWLKQNYKAVNDIYCLPNENCRVRPEDKIIQISDPIQGNNAQFISAVYKDAKYLGDNLQVGTSYFVAAGDKVYLIKEDTDPNILKAITFNP